MDEEVTIIDSNSRNQKTKIFLINNKKILIVGFSIILILIIGFLSLKEIKKQNKIKIANQFNTVTINFKTEEAQITIDQLTKLIKENDVTYSPLALYFLIDNNLIDSQDEINSLFDKVINKTDLDPEIKNLVIYKKALFNSDSETKDADNLVIMLAPITGSVSIWKSHALYLLAEYFYSKNQKQKAKEYFNKILILPKANSYIKEESKKRLNRDFGE